MSKLLHDIYCIATGHNRGFGIHSPLAFKTVKDAISPHSRYGLYAYHDIHDMMCGAEVPLLHWCRVRRTVRLAVRIAVFFGLRRYTMQGRMPEPEEDLLREVLPKVGCREGGQSGMTTLRIVALPDCKLPLHSDGSVILAFGCRRDVEGMLEQVRTTLQHGIIFDGYNKVLVILTPDSVLTEYKIRL